MRSLPSLHWQKHVIYKRFVKGNYFELFKKRKSIDKWICFIQSSGWDPIPAKSGVIKSMEINGL